MLLLTRPQQVSPTLATLAYLQEPLPDEQIVLAYMHGRLLPALQYQHTILRKDYLGLRSIFFGVNNNGGKLYSLKNLTSPSTVIPDIRSHRERGELVHQNIQETPRTRGNCVG